MKRTIGGAALAAALALAAPAQAMTSTPRGAVPDVLMSEVQGGVVEAIEGTALKVKGKTYFLSATAVIYGNDGARSGVQRLAPGKAVSFTVIDDASKNRIKQLWINN